MPPTQPTFIPRTPIPAGRRSTGLGWFFAVSFLFLAGSGIATGGMWLYRGLLVSQIAGYSDTLQKVETEFEPALVLELRRTAQAIDVGRDLLKKHVAVSRLLKFVEDNTLPDTRFTRFIYKDGGLILSGAARSYSALAQQSLVFEKAPSVKKSEFSDFSLGRDGFVNFRAELVVDPSLIAYQGQ